MDPVVPEAAAVEEEPLEEDVVPAAELVGEEETAAVEDVRGTRRGNSNKKQQKDTPGVDLPNALPGGWEALSYRFGKIH